MTHLRGKRSPRSEARRHIKQHSHWVHEDKESINLLTVFQVQHHLAALYADFNTAAIPIKHRGEVLHDPRGAGTFDRSL